MGAMPRGGARAAVVIEIALKREAMMTRREGWGQDNPAFRQIFASWYIPEGSPEQWRWWDDLQRISISPENAVKG